MKIYGKIYGLGLEIGLQKVVLDSRDSVALERKASPKEAYKDIRKDIRNWFENWFAKVVLGSRDSVVLETWDYEDIREDIRTDKASPKEAYN